MTGTSSSPAARVRASPPGTDAITDPAAQQPTRIVLGGHGGRNAEADPSAGRAADGSNSRADLPAAQPPGQPLMWQ
ncbi:hypothetical protein NDU88_009754 [Pleurodeles waltl]|uniref:Uncharacterized protein n=1 Tax=Pleurodeles waltl TaxID=8319 RepID=A0AAV7QTX1_PLEWA|nr:hypothetical protein NDU88_009754 [Pleurodeles waltl]